MDSEAWEELFSACVAWLAAHGRRPDDVQPRNATERRLGTWLAHQSMLAGQGRLQTGRLLRLKEAGLGGTLRAKRRRESRSPAHGNDRTAGPGQGRPAGAVAAERQRPVSRYRRRRVGGFRMQDTVLRVPVALLNRVVELWYLVSPEGGALPGAAPEAIAELRGLLAEIDERYRVPLGMLARATGVNRSAYRTWLRRHPAGQQLPAPPSSAAAEAAEEAGAPLRGGVCRAGHPQRAENLVSDGRGGSRCGVCARERAQQQRVRESQGNPPTRRNAPWTMAEDRLVLVAETTDLELARLLHRTVGSIRARRAKLRRSVGDRI
ncbi:hypothetical protein J4H92_01420 [Leucobacter weissii]|uniref:Helicase-associated domain-containing protein n=1 Tax=Leucobacter weissii TaxID=1983706 RepID=A0A939MLG0_9MICO|nr:helicase associated domain-containing protein [Leucobacter weissii]MBO1900606.1 hypothetical protein [Leucobacter weissii]